MTNIMKKIEGTINNIRIIIITDNIKKKEITEKKTIIKEIKIENTTKNIIQNIPIKIIQESMKIITIENKETINNNTEKNKIKIKIKRSIVNVIMS